MSLNDLGGNLLKSLEQLEHLTSVAPVLFYSSDLHGKSIIDDDIAPIIDLCNDLDQPNGIQVVLHANGGMVHVVQRIGQVLWESAPTVKFIVPERARSAATLLAFSGTEIQMREDASLGPVDPMIQTVSERVPGQMQVVSSEDVRAFTEMASKWFGVSVEDHGAMLLSTICQRVFPLSLSSFFRAEKYVREVATAHLTHQLPHAREGELDAIIDHFLSKHASHDALIGLTEAQRVGLNAVRLDQSLTPAILQIMNLCKSICQSNASAISGVLASKHRVMVYQNDDALADPSHLRQSGDVLQHQMHWFTLNTGLESKSEMTGTNGQPHPQKTI